MSDHIAREVLSRMNLREVALAPHYSGLAADLRSLSMSQPSQEQQAFLARRADLCAAYGLAPVEQTKPFAFSGGVAIVPVHGTLINRFGASYGYVTGYNFIRSQTAAAGLDPDVTHIVFDHNSYGGEAAGCFEAAADIPVLANGKPTIAVIDSNCYSASYALASQCDQIVCTPSGGAGSVGVVAMHVDMSKMLAEWGIVITLIAAGEHKVDGNPYEALPPAVRKDIKTNVEKSRVNFAQLVADGREMDLKAVLDTEARVYRADDALAVGFIDAIASPQAAVQAFIRDLNGSQTSTTKGTSMKTPEQLAAEQQAAQQAAVTEAASTARTAERARISGIQSCEQAKGREALASHLALNTDMSLEAAQGILAASPKVEPAAAAVPAAQTTGAANPFAAAMDATKNPKVGADSTVAGGGANGGELPLHMQILRDQEAATGLKLVKSA